MDYSEIELAKAAREYQEAVAALHTTHSSTDVHGHGGVAGWAITQHCAVTCGALDARFDPSTGRVVGDMSRRFHEDVLARYEAADARLRELLS